MCGSCIHPYRNIVGSSNSYSAKSTSLDVHKGRMCMWWSAERASRRDVVGTWCSRRTLRLALVVVVVLIALPVVVLVVLVVVLEVLV